MTTATDYTLDVAFFNLATRAAQTIQAHHGRNGTCAICGTSSPCGQAILAAHNLEVTSVAVQWSAPDSGLKRCDNRSVGVIITDGHGRYLVFDRNTYPPGTAACAGHVDDHGTDEDAARGEVFEELGLVVDELVPLAAGWRNNPCRRAPGPPGQGHQWTVYMATARGTLSPSAREIRNVRWVSRAELQTCYTRTLALAVHTISVAEFTDDPGLELSWPLWFSRAGVVQASEAELALIEMLFRNDPHVSEA